MTALLTVFIDILLHRRGPEDLPALRFLLAIALCAYLLVGFLVILISERWYRALAILAVDAALYLGFVKLVLILAGFPVRFVQTATALMGIHVLLNTLALPFLFWLAIATGPDGLASLPSAAVLPASALLALLIWSLDVSGFIFARAISRPYMTGVLIVIGYFLLSLFVRGAIFPPQS